MIYVKNSIDWYKFYCLNPLASFNIVSHYVLNDDCQRFETKNESMQFGSKESCFRQSNTFDRSVWIAAHTLFKS